MAGRSYNGSNYDISIVRYNSNGSLDSSFGTGGIVTTLIGSGNDGAFGIAIQSDGKIVAAGFSNNGSNDDFALVRYNNDGSPDSSFGIGGIVTTSIGSGNDVALAGIAIQSDGKIVVAGRSNNGSNDDFALVRYNNDGSPDSSFGIVGKVITPIGSDNDEANAMIISSDGKIVLVGKSYNGLNYEFAIARYNVDGSLDAGFGNGGIITQAIGIGGVADVSIQPDGKIVVTGSSYNGLFNEFTVIRYNSDGTLDTCFGNSGFITTSVVTSKSALAEGIALQSDGKIVVAGWFDDGPNTDFAIVRYLPGISPAINIASITNIGSVNAIPTATATGDCITERGFFWWTDAGYTSGTVPAGGTGTGNYSMTLSNLQPLTTYHISAYIKVGSQLFTSPNSLTFTTTQAMIPTVHTSPQLTVSGFNVTASGEITDVGSTPVTIYGFVYAIHPSPTVWDMALPFTWDMTLPISQGKPFSGTIKNLAPGTYHIRSYAHNSIGTAYGEEYSFAILAPGFSVSPVSSITSESGGTASFQVKLNTLPTADVSISFSSSDTGEGTILPGSLTFTTQNWNVFQTVIITGIDDYLADGNQAYSINFSPSVSDDPLYSNLTPNPVSLTNTDNDLPGFTVSQISGNTSENKTTATFTVRLNSQPTADVKLGLTSSDPTEGMVSPDSLTFTPQNWNTPQTVTVTGADDSEVDGEQTYRITFSPAVSDDSAYNGLKPDDVAVINTDNDIANHAPLANPDTYSVNQDSSLNISAPGVLANDTDADYDYLSAITISNPANGILTLNSGGSFIYTPKSGFYGTDRFTYKAYDSKAYSSAATVTVTVNYVPPYIPPVIVPDQPPPIIDECPDSEKTSPGICGCDKSDTDSDGDSVYDCHDGCPNDAKKTEPGKCGCGVSDTDSDGDSTADCKDLCPQDPKKTAPGICGCGISDTDSDGDSVYDCHDGCPNDAKKTEPGKCGCGVSDMDSDGDGVYDCKDSCPNDPNKSEPGKCGCGKSEKECEKPHEPPKQTGPEDGQIVSPGNITLKAEPPETSDDSKPVKVHWIITDSDDPDKVIVIVGDYSEDGIIGVIPDDLEPGREYEWKVGYEYPDGDIVWSSEQTFVVGLWDTEPSEESQIIRIEPGYEMSDFRAVSVGLVPADPGFTSVLGSIMGNSLDRDNYRIAGYDTERRAYIEYGLEEFKVIPGKAYWFLARNGLTATVRGVRVSTSADFRLCLDYNSDTGNGWNFIASPNNADYYWEKLKIVIYDTDSRNILKTIRVADMAVPNDYLDNRLWRWEKGNYASDTAIIEHYQGYWVRAKKSGVCLIFSEDAQIGSDSGSLRKSRNAVSESQTSPPMPVSGFADKSQDIDMAGGGCFIRSLF